jgi:hypothetical protein
MWRLGSSPSERVSTPGSSLMASWTALRSAGLIGSSAFSWPDARTSSAIWTLNRLSAAERRSRYPATSTRIRSVRDGHWRCTTARVRSWSAARVDPRGPTKMPRSSPRAAISTVSSSSRRVSTVPSMPNSLSRPATKARPTSPCSSSVIPSAMSTVSFASLLRCGAFSGGCPREPFLEPSPAAPSLVVALLRLRRRRAERLVPEPVPAVVVVPEPVPAAVITGPSEPSEPPSSPSEVAARSPWPPRPPWRLP